MTNKQQINGHNNIQIANLTGNVIIGVQAELASLSNKANPATPITKDQASKLRAIIDGIDTLDTEQGRKSERALLFFIANKAAGLEKEHTYKDIPADKYITALEAIHQHVRTRKFKKQAGA